MNQTNLGPAIDKPIPPNWPSQETWNRFWCEYGVNDLFDPADPPIKPRQHPYELYLFLKFMRGRQLNNILEIGTYRGGTLWFWIQLLDKTKHCNIVSIDNFSEDYFYDPKGGTNYAELWKSWCPSDSNFNFLCGNSIDPDIYNQACSLVGPEKLDFIFMDGWHATDHVFKEFEMYLELLKPGGVAALHDTTGWDVKVFCDDLRTKHTYYEAISEYSPHGIGWIIKE